MGYVEHALTVVLNVPLFISKVKFSHNTAYGQSGCFHFLFQFSCAILLSKMKSLFFNLSTSANLTYFSVDYSGAYVLAYSFKGFS